MFLFIEKLYYFLGTILLNNQNALDNLKNDFSIFLGVETTSQLPMILCVILFMLIFYILFRLLQIILGLFVKFIGGVWGA
jgi:hypothetical protein